MIGNDIVDLAKAKAESNIFRPRYLSKVCNQQEVDLILSNMNSYNTFWRIWTMKESAYKALQRQIRFSSIFNPLAFGCYFEDSETGKVNFQEHQLTTTTLQTENFMYSEIMTTEAHQRFFGSTLNFLLKLKQEWDLRSLPKISKSKLGLPFLNLQEESLPVSKTHHGNFQVFQY